MNFLKAASAIKYDKKNFFVALEGFYYNFKTKLPVENYFQKTSTFGKAFLKALQKICC